MRRFPARAAANDRDRELPQRSAVTSNVVAHVVINVSRTTLAVIETVLSARAWHAPNGSQTGRRNCSTCRISTLCSPCRR